MIKYMIFDLDGTLLDTIGDIANTCNIILKRHDQPPFSVDDYKYFVGKGVRHLIHQMLKARKLPEDLFEEFLDEYHEIYPEESTKTTKIYDGLMDALVELKDLDIRLAVLSNKPHHQVVELMPLYFPKGFFDVVYGKHDEFKAKPDPALLNRLIQSMNAKKSEVLYIGDTKTDMETALNGHLASVGVLWGFRDEKELVKAKASYIIKEPQELVHLVKEINRKK